MNTMTPLEMYEQLRAAHNMIKELMDYKDQMTNEQINAIDSLHGVLYLVEGVFSNQEPK